MNWIKMTANLDTKPEVMMLADLLGVHELHVVGLLWKLWTWLDQNIETSNGVTVTAALLDRVTCNGMSVALVTVGWLKGEDGALDFPNFDRHNGETAKARALNAKRAKKFRASSTVTPPSRSRNATTVTREEKRREEKKRVTPPPTLPEIQAFCTEAGLPPADAEATFHKWEANGFTNNAKPIKDWKATIRAWKAAGYMPSQKAGMNGKATPVAAPASRPFNPEEWQ
jgi:hypothetical protein